MPRRRFGRVPREHRTPGRGAQLAGMGLLAASAVFPLYFMISGAFRTQADWNRSELGLPTTASLSAFKPGVDRREPRDLPAQLGDRHGAAR